MKEKIFRNHEDVYSPLGLGLGGKGRVLNQQRDRGWGRSGISWRTALRCTGGDGEGVTAGVSRAGNLVFIC